MSASSEARARLAAQQAALADALLAGGEPPAGFDVARVKAAAEALAQKRRRSVAQVWPATFAALGREFGKLFAAYAAGHPLPGAGGPLADGEAFARWLRERDAFPAAGGVEWMAVRLRFRRFAGGLAPRRGFSAGWLWQRDPQRLILAFRLAGRFERFFSLPLRLPFSLPLNLWR